MVASRGGSQCFVVVSAFMVGVFALWADSTQAMLSLARSVGLARGNSGSSCTSTAWRRRDRISIRCASNWDDFMGKVEDLLPEESADIAHPGGVPGPAPVRSRIEQTESNQIERIKPSPVEQKTIQGRRVFIKRDDLLRLPGSQISGNKARKMYSLNQIPADKFPSCVVSYGGPQSNAMLALAAVVNYKNRELTSGADEQSNSNSIRFVYYTKKLPRFLKKQASGNLFRAVALGMEILELSPKNYHDLFGGEWGGNADPPVGLVPPNQSDFLWVPQGGACEMAVEGVNILAQEILSFWSKEGNNKPLSVVLPGGTCTTAVLVHHALSALTSENEGDEDAHLDIQVVVVPCVGDAAYAQRQMMALSAQIGASADDIPHILSPYPETFDRPEMEGNKNKYFPFGEPDEAILQVFNLLKEEYGLVLDLVYGAPTWTILIRHFDVPLSADLTFDPRNPIAGREIMVVDCGGLEGINTQLLRYKYKGLVDIKDIQLP